MKKLLSILSGFLLLMVFNTTIAQDLVLNRDSLSKSGGKGDIIAPKTYVKNLSKDTLVLRWVRQKSDISSQWRKPGVCDKNLCYDNKDSAIFKLAPNDSGQMKINFYAYDNNGEGKTGEGVLDIRIYDTTQTYASGKVIHFKGETFFGGSSIGKENFKEAVDFYPNPVTNKLNIKFPGIGQYKVTLYNILGKSFKEKKISGKDKTTFDLSDLKQGTYVMKIRNQKGEATTKTFSKK